MAVVDIKAYNQPYISVLLNNCWLSMISRISLISLALLLMSCGGGGGSSAAGAGSGASGSSNTDSSSTDFGTVTLEGQTEVWSDQTNWTLSARADGLDSTAVSFQLAADNSGLEIDSTTGLIQGVATTPGVYDLEFATPPEPPEGVAPPETPEQEGQQPAPTPPAGTGVQDTTGAGGGTIGTGIAPVPGEQGFTGT